jgi:3-deoxy-D-manno-octulosonate 8-phosphate phosphatase (KDO 8-P phosphatase)
MNNSIDKNSELMDRLMAIRLIVFDFDGVFTDNAVWVLEDGKEAVRCSRSDGIGLQQLTRIGIAYLIISTETNPVVSARSKKLKIRCIQGCHKKIETLKEVASEYKIEFSQIAFVGNDINDLECLKSVGMPIIVKDSHKDVMKHAAYITNCKGGHGAVREICDLMKDVYGLKEQQVL